jgi:hypothetical protein
MSFINPFLKPNIEESFVAFEESEMNKANQQERARQSAIDKLRNAMNQTRATKGGSAQRVRRAAPPTMAPNNRRGVTSIRPPASTGSIVRNPQLRTLVVSHSEPFFGVALTAAGALNFNRAAIIPAVFPYLAGIASNFSRYKWRRLRIYYVPSCPTSTQGEVALGTVDSFEDANAATFVQVATMSHGISFPPWGGTIDRGPDAITLDIDCNRFEKPRYNYVATTQFNSYSNPEKDSVTPILLCLATQGSTAAVTIAGRVWISYTIELIDPIPAGVNG